MKIGRYTSETGAETLGVVLARGSTLEVLDLSRAGRLRRAAGDDDLPTTMDGFIDGGAAELDRARALVDWACLNGEASLFQAERVIRWMLPIKVRNCIAAGRNFGKHRAETLEYWKSRGARLHTDIPMAFIKLASAMVPTRSTVQVPPCCSWFDYEIEPTAVIGRSASNLRETNALSAVFGYTILNDLSAREVQRSEMANQSILMGKNYPGLGPLGPWIVTADEIPNPSQLSMQLTVNGETRQQADCSGMIFSFEQLVAYWSQLGLARGDLITAGTPEGVAIGRDEPARFYLKPGDQIVAKVTQIGALETDIEASPVESDVA